MEKNIVFSVLFVGFQSINENTLDLDVCGRWAGRACVGHKNGGISAKGDCRSAGVEEGESIPGLWVWIVEFSADCIVTISCSWVQLDVEPTSRLNNQVSNCLAWG
jgi:hypothetical protein